MKAYKPPLPVDGDLADAIAENRWDAFWDGVLLGFFIGAFLMLGAKEWGLHLDEKPKTQTRQTVGGN